MVVSVGCAPYSWFDDETMLLPANLIAAFRTRAAKSQSSILARFDCSLGEIAMGLTMTTNYLVWSIPGFLLLVLYGKWTGVRAVDLAEQS